MREDCPDGAGRVALGPRAEVDAAARLTAAQHVTEVGLLPLDPDQALREVLERVRAGLRASAATILLVEDGTEDLVARASAGLEHLVAAGVRIPMGGGIAGRVAATRQPALVADIAMERVANPLLLASGVRSMAAVPLTAAGAVIGVLHVTSTRPGAFAEEDLSLLQLLADRVALGVERVRVTERELAATAALRVSEQRARAVLETAVDGIVTIDRAGRVESMNPAAERMFGYAAREVVGRNVSMLMPEPYRSEHDEYLARYLRTGQRRIIGIGREVVGRRRDGSTFPMELAVSDVGPEVGLFTGIVRDITERKQFEAQLAHHALHDPLTGLGNRTLLMQRLEHALARLPRHPGMLALLFLDLDRFKLVNDTLGHEAGDELLIEAAGLLRRALRPEDMVARLGGDEFVVLCEDLTSQADAEAVARRLADALNVPVCLRRREVFLSASIGVVTTSGGVTATELMRDADTAMYQAKEQGRGRYALLDDDAREEMSDRLQLSSDLRRALERNELRVVYQPLVDLDTGEVVAAEALLRWQHPERGLLAPAAFLRIAEDVGTIVDFDAWMMRTACLDTAQWGRQMGRPLAVWVNVSGRSLADPGLVPAVADALARSGLDAGLLTLEITEGALMRDAATTVRTLTALRELGVQLAVDDFGTGYSSLAYLEQFPVHTLKVDRSFVAGLDEGVDNMRGSAAITRAIVSLAAGLQLRTVAEGIETPGQLDAVTALGCTLGQGYFLGRPASRDSIVVAAPHGVALPSAYADALLTAG